MSFHRFVIGVMGAVYACALTVGTTWAQAIERHAPQVPPGETAPLATPEAIAAEGDATVVGPALRAIVVIGTNDPVNTDMVEPSGALRTTIDVGAVARLAHDRQIRGQLAPYLDQPLSRKLIAQIEATLVRHYRAAHYPFVALSTPEQDLGLGVLNVRVVEFVAGSVAVQGAAADEVTHIKARIGLQPGMAINDRDLIYDLDSLNHYPFRHVQPVFTPGEALGTSDLVLTVARQRPWQIYAGTDTSGSRATGWLRYFLGGALGNVLGRDSVLALQATGSADAIRHGLHHPRYESVSSTYTLPLSSRALLEANVNLVESNQAGNAFFTSRLNDVEGALGIRIAAPGLSFGAGRSDVRIGMEAKHLRSLTIFAGSTVFAAKMSSYLAYLGVHHAHDGPHTQLDIDLAAHFSPGGIDSGNTAPQFALFSQDRAIHARYGYATIDVDHTLTLGKALNWDVQIVGQAATTPLPRSEQAGLGGQSLIRGYSQDDGAYDENLVMRNELNFTTRPLRVERNTTVSISPQAFVDYGIGRDLAAHRLQRLASVGGGASATLGRTLSLHIDAAHVLKTGPATAKTNNRVAASLRISY